MTLYLSKTGRQILGPAGPLGLQIHDYTFYRKNLVGSWDLQNLINMTLNIFLKVKSHNPHSVQLGVLHMTLYLLMLSQRQGLRSAFIS